MLAYKVKINISRLISPKGSDGGTMGHHVRWIENEHDFPEICVFTNGRPHTQGMIQNEKLQNNTQSSLEL